MNDATRLRMAIAALAFAAVAPLANAASVHPVSGRNPSVVLPAGGNGNSIAPSLSPGGRYVVFSSSAIDLVPGENSQPRLDVFLRDRLWNTTTLVSGNFSGAGGGNADSTCGQVSSSGRYVVFQSDASDLVLGDLKFSGNSARCRRRWLLYHGTLLYDFPLALVARCLKMPPRALAVGMVLS